VALYLLASHLHGQGLAAEAFAALQAWAQQQGARWLRLGVVQANLRARRFWARLGFEQVRTREMVNDDGHVNQVLVMIKCLAADATLGDYLAQVPRDQPASSLP
jgi:RimJ/RimL family protein N-acetyltransferase